MSQHDRTPHLGVFTFRDITCTDAHAAACYIDGLPEAPIDQVTFEHVSVSFSSNATPFIPAMQNDSTAQLRMGFYFNNVRKVCVHDVRISGVTGPALITKNCGLVERTELYEEI